MHLRESLLLDEFLVACFLGYIVEGSGLSYIRMRIYIQRGTLFLRVGASITKVLIFGGQGESQSHSQNFTVFLTKRLQKLRRRFYSIFALYWIDSFVIHTELTLCLHNRRHEPWPTSGSLA